MRTIGFFAVMAVLCLGVSGCVSVQEAPITQFGAVGDGITLNTTAIQQSIDSMAASGGGTVVVPAGNFLSGALFLKPGVNLRLEKDSALVASTDMKDFPEQRTRIEGHYEEHFNPALINADGCDGLEISGEGTLDGAGKPIWDSFWENRKIIKGFKNLDQPRARMCLIENSENVTVRGITFKDAQFWNLHLYNCRNVLVEKVSFVVPDNEKPPSSDGVDVDSCQHVSVRGCYFSVNDDCVALKGSKGPFAMEDKDSPPVEHIRVSDCVFKRGHGVVTCGSEATVVRDVVVEDCELIGSMSICRLKLRPDTPQCYENLTFRNIKVDHPKARIFSIKKWSQYFDPQGQPEPTSYVRNIHVSGITGRIGSLGVITGNAKTQFGPIVLEKIDVQAEDSAFQLGKTVSEVALENVRVNGKAYSLGR